MILPVKHIRRPSMTASAVSSSPSTTIVLGSISSLLTNFFLLNGGICSGTVSSIYLLRTFAEKVDKFLKLGPVSTNPVVMS